MNIFPAPNFAGAGYNYLFQEESLGRPRNQHLFRFDLHPTEKDTFSVKGSTWHADTIGYHVAGGSSGWGLVRQHYQFTGDQLTLNYTKIITPRLVNEAFVGFFIDTEDGRTPSDDREPAHAAIRSRAVQSCQSGAGEESPFSSISTKANSDGVVLMTLCSAPAWRAYDAPWWSSTLVAPSAVSMRRVPSYSGTTT